MKKIYMSALGLMIAASAFAQTVKVTFQVDMKNETVASQGLRVAGDYQQDAGMANNWTPGDAAAQASNGGSGTVYSLQVTLKANSTYQYKFVNFDGSGGWEGPPAACTNGGGNREIKTGSNDTVISVVCFNSCGPCPATQYKRDVKFMVVDSNASVATHKLTSVAFKGSMSGWSDFAAYDDGTNGDKTAGDGVFTAIYNVKEGSWEWGATDKGSWIIQGPNRTLTMSSNGTVTGDTVYSMAKLGALIDLTFNVDMSDTIVNSEGVYVSGNFLAFLENPLGNWNKDTIKLDRNGTTKTYSKTVKIYAGNYQFKYYNGKGNADDSRGENWNFEATGCGVPNGLGGFNRTLDLRGKTSASVLPMYMWNRCAISGGFSTTELPAGSFRVFPNPSKGQFEVALNEGNIAGVQVLDLAGRSIRSFSAINARSFNMKQTLSSGLYLVNITDQAGRTASVKLVVE